MLPLLKLYHFQQKSQASMSLTRTSIPPLKLTKKKNNNPSSDRFVLNYRLLAVIFEGLNTGILTSSDKLALRKLFDPKLMNDNKK